MHRLPKAVGLRRHQTGGLLVKWRNLVAGALLLFGLTQMAGDLTGILRSGDRSTAGQLAPPHGLCLWRVNYSVE